MKSKVALAFALIAGVFFASSFKMMNRNVNHFTKRSAKRNYSKSKPQFLGVYVGEFSTGDDPGEPFKVYVNSLDRDSVEYCYATNNGPNGPTTQLPATGSYNSTTHIVTGFSCTYAVVGSTPPEDNTVNYTGTLTQ